MAIVNFEPGKNRKLSEKEKEQIRKAKNMPITYDEDSPEMDDKMEAAFIAARKVKPYRGKTLLVNVSSETFEKAERLGEDYRVVFGKLLDRAVQEFHKTM